MTISNETRICSKCGATHARRGQRWCHACHAEYQREWRKTHPNTELGHVAVPTASNDGIDGPCKLSHVKHFARRGRAA